MSKKISPEDNLALTQRSLEQWLSFKRYMSKAFSEEELTSDDEGKYLDIKSDIAKNFRTMNERFKDMKGLDYGGKVMKDMLTKCVSVAHLRNLPDADKRNLEAEWHTAFVALSRTVGAFKFMSEGYVPVQKAKKKTKGGGGGKGIIITVVVLAVAGGAAWFFLFQ